MKSLHAAAFAAAALACLLATHAIAHVTLEQPQAVAGSTYKAVVRVPHGCEGSPTVRLRVQIPDGVLNVKPMPKPGWELTVVRGKLDKPVAGDHGAQITEGVREVIWSGGRLLDENYDEFVFRGTLPNRPGETLHFPTVSECEKGVDRWIEIPEPGKRPDDYRHPAPSLRLTPRN
jgi:uncharacterized protein YcnI